MEEIIGDGIFTEISRNKKYPFEFKLVDDLEFFVTGSKYVFDKYEYTPYTSVSGYLINSCVTPSGHKFNLVQVSPNINCLSILVPEDTDLEEFFINVYTDAKNKGISLQKRYTDEITTLTNCGYEEAVKKRYLMRFYANSYYELVEFCKISTENGLQITSWPTYSQSTLEIMANFVAPECMYYKILAGNWSIANDNVDFNTKKCTASGLEIIARIGNVIPMKNEECEAFNPMLVLCSLDIEVLNEDECSFSNVDSLMSNKDNIVCTISMIFYEVYLKGGTRQIKRCIISIGSKRLHSFEEGKDAKIMVEDEHELLVMVGILLRISGFDVMSGHNIRAFDYPVIMKAIIRYNDKKDILQLFTTRILQNEKEFKYIFSLKTHKVALAQNAIIELPMYQFHDSSIKDSQYVTLDAYKIKKTMISLNDSCKIFGIQPKELMKFELLNSMLKIMKEIPEPEDATKEELFEKYEKLINRVISMFKYDNSAREMVEWCQNKLSILHSGNVEIGDFHISMQDYILTYCMQDSQSSAEIIIKTNVIINEAVHRRETGMNEQVYSTNRMMRQVSQVNRMYSNIEGNFRIIRNLPYKCLAKKGFSHVNGGMMAQNHDRPSYSHKILVIGDLKNAYGSIMAKAAGADNVFLERPTVPGRYFELYILSDNEKEVVTRWVRIGQSEDGVIAEGHATLREVFKKAMNKESDASKKMLYNAYQLCLKREIVSKYGVSAKIAPSSSILHTVTNCITMVTAWVLTRTMAFLVKETYCKSSKELVHSHTDSVFFLLNLEKHIPVPFAHIEEDDYSAYYAAVTENIDKIYELAEFVIEKANEFIEDLMGGKELLLELEAVAINSLMLHQLQYILKGIRKGAKNQ